MAKKLKSDQTLFLATILLVGLSIVMVYSASAVVAMERYQQPYLFLIKQLLWVVLGLGLLWVVMQVDYRLYRNPAFIWTGVGVVGLCLVAVLFSPPVNNARRWFSVGGLGIQPSELAKLSAIFFTAALLERRMHRINEVRYALTPIACVVLGFVALIMLEPDFGTSVSLVIIVAMMVFAAGLNYSYIAGAVLAGLPLVAYLAISAPYRMKRLMTFMNPWADPLGDGFQIIQSLIAIGTGGVTGRGLMNGVQKLFYLPEPHSDFIFAVIAEELGLIGTTLVVLCFCVITWRGLRVTLRAPDTFGAFLALGLTTMVAVQAFVNMSVVLGLAP
ncbi:MAG TPA: putative peptidoglycan glycosyltransferase FtsW, partial [Vicinamibacterales bacterium]